MSANKIQLKQSDLPEIREKILHKQNGLCPICNCEVNDPCVDHSHKKKLNGSGLVRGVLCRNHNTFIAKIENNCIRCNISISELPNILRNIADYLEKKEYPYIHPTEKPKEKKLKKSSYNKLKKIYDGKAKLPEYPKSKKLTKKLSKLFKKYNLKPEFYKQKGE